MMTTPDKIITVFSFTWKPAAKIPAQLTIAVSIDSGIDNDKIALPVLLSIISALKVYFPFLHFSLRLIWSFSASAVLLVIRMPFDPLFNRGVLWYWVSFVPASI